MNNINAKEMVDQIRTLLDETSISSGKWNDKEIVRAINSSKDHLVNIINTIKPEITGKNAPIVFVAGQELYDLPADCDSIRRIEVDSDKGKVDLIPMDKKELFRATTDNILDPSRYYYVWGNQIGLINVSGDCTIYYSRKVPNIHYGTAKAGSVTSLTFADNPNGTSSGDYTTKRIDDYYIGAYIDIYSGTSSPQIVKITDYVGSTNVASFATASVAPSADSLYALQFDLPLEIDQCIVYKAAILLAPKDKAIDISKLTAVYNTLFTPFSDGLTVTKEKKFINYID